jgi:hypothetical protein
VGAKLGFRCPPDGLNQSQGLRQRSQGLGADPGPRPQKCVSVQLCVKTSHIIFKTQRLRIRQKQFGQGAAQPPPCPCPAMLSPAARQPQGVSPVQRAPGQERETQSEPGLR